MQAVELHNAFMWDCPDCGRENFCRCITWEPPSEEERVEAIRKAEGLDAWEELPDGLEGHFTMAPDEVTCPHCDRTFAVDVAGLDGRDADDDEPPTEG
jgi:hypothetical protein